MEHLKKEKKLKAPEHRGRSGPVPPTIRAGHDGKRLLNDTGSLQKILNICHALHFFFFWLMNECRPVGFKGKKGSLFELPKHWIVLVLYIFILIFFFLYPGLSLVRAYWRKLSSGKATSYSASLPADQRCRHEDSTDTSVESVALEKHLMVDAPKKLTSKKKKKNKRKKNLNYELNAFGGKKSRENIVTNFVQSSVY